MGIFLNLPQVLLLAVMFEKHCLDLGASWGMLCWLMSE